MNTSVACTIVLVTLVAGPSFGATYYASPTGGGDGRSETTPFLVGQFWEIAEPGDTLLMLDGRYAGDGSMINPPQGLHGTPEAPITVKAVNDGAVEIDGEGRRQPALLRQNDHFVLEGFNAHSAGPRNATVVELSGSNYSIVRRVCAWDASDGNTDVIGVHHGEHNLFEDCAAWGIARKTYSNSQGGNYTTYRRCFGRWEGCTAVGPKMTYSAFYNSHHITFENCIGTWDARKMPESHQAMGYDGKPFADWGSGPKEPHEYQDYVVDQPYGVFSADNYYPDVEMPRNGPYLYGCIAYVLPSPKLRAFSGVFQIGWGRERDDGYMENCLAYVHPDVTTAGPAFGLFQFRGKNLTAVGGATQLKESQIGSVRQSETGEEIVAERGHLLDTPDGAAILCRYKDGELTDQPLWPWPMNQRIIDAMELAGYDDPVDVTKTVFELAGGKLPEAPGNR
jgi:hypothetical protein